MHLQIIIAIVNYEKLLKSGKHSVCFTFDIKII